MNSNIEHCGPWLMSQNYNEEWRRQVNRHGPLESKEATFEQEVQPVSSARLVGVVHTLTTGVVAVSGAVEPVS